MRMKKKVPRGRQSWDVKSGPEGMRQRQRNKAKERNREEAAQFEASINQEIKIRAPETILNLSLKRGKLTHISHVIVSFPRPVPVSLIYKVIKDGRIRTWLEKEAKKENLRSSQGS